MSNDLRECPFCGEPMHFRSNRDWHRIAGPHDPDCILHDDESPMWPATDEGRAEATAAWNRRARPTVTASNEEEALQERLAAVRQKIASYGGGDRPPSPPAALLREEQTLLNLLARDPELQWQPNGRE